MNTQSVSIPVGNEKLSALLYIPEVSNNVKLPSVVIFHGRGSSKKRYADRGEALAKKGILTLIFDFRGCGESEGDFSKQTIEMGFEDAVAGYTFLKNHPLCDNARLGVLGGSFGGYQAALLSGEHPFSSLILAAPAIYQDDWWNIVPEAMDPGRKELYRKQAGFGEAKAMKVIRKYSGYILIIEHEKDEIIPQRVTEAYYQNAVSAKLKEKKIIANAPHALHDKVYIDQSISIVSDWFTKTL